LASAIWIAKHNRDHAEQRHDQRLDPAEADVLQPEDQEHVERGDDHAELERNAEQQIEPDRGPDHLGQIGRADRDLAHHPERPRGPAGKRVAQACARSRPAPMPSRAHSACNRIAMTLR
jgi:hypothetical protein